MGVPKPGSYSQVKLKVILAFFKSMLVPTLQIFEGERFLAEQTPAGYSNWIQKMP